MRKLCEESRSSGTQEVADMADRIEERSDETLPYKYRAVAIAFRLNASAIPATAIADELEALWRVVLGGGVGSTNHTDADELEEQFTEWWASEFGGEPNFDHGAVVDMFMAWKGGLGWKR